MTVGAMDCFSMEKIVGDMKSVFLLSHPSELKEDVEWCAKNGIGYYVPNVLAFPDKKTKEEAARLHEEYKLRYAFSVNPLMGDMVEIEWMGKNEVSVYVNHEFDICEMVHESYRLMVVAMWRKVINYIIENRSKNSVITVMWSPYISDINSEPKKIMQYYRKFISEIYHPLVVLVSAVQDGVGCSGHETYTEKWGDRRPGEKDYDKLLSLLKAHRDACGHIVKSCVNVELFSYRKEEKQWICAPYERIKEQMKRERMFGEIGPCWILGRGAMGYLYDTSELKKKYEKGEI